MGIQDCVIQILCVVRCKWAKQGDGYWAGQGTDTAEVSGLILTGATYTKKVISQLKGLFD